MQEFPIEIYLENLYVQLTNAQPQKVELTTAWYQSFSQVPGVYLFRDQAKIIYVGETRDLRLRMDTLRRTVNHTLRRNIGNHIFSHIDGFTKATSKKRFIDTIEEMVNDHFRYNLTVTVLPVALGSLELEALIIKRHNPLYNKKGKNALDLTREN